MDLAASTMQRACAVMLVCATELAAQGSADGQSRSRLKRELHDSVVAVVTAAIQDSAFPGAYVVVGDTRGTLAEHGAGRLDWTPKSPRPSSKTLWDLASLTKVIGTTTAFAQLVEGGQVDLDAPVQRYVSAWVGADKESVTVRHLLTHTSGLPSFKPYDQQTHDPDSLAALLFTTPLERRPGERMVYSDIGAHMLGVIIERVSGQRLDAYLKNSVFERLKMNETMFNPPKRLLKRIAPTEVQAERGGQVHGVVHDERAFYIGGIAPHAGLFSTGKDLARFATAMLRGGTLDGQRVLKRETISLFSAYVDSTFSNRGLGWQKPDLEAMPYKTPSAAWAGQFMSGRAYGHTGFTGTSIAIDPKLDVYIILLSNRVNPTRNNPRITQVRRRLADAVVTAVRRHRGQTISTGNQ
jgi:CubicO group peptidase (beta-lactamase class C family)